MFGALYQLTSISGVAIMKRYSDFFQTHFAMRKAYESKRDLYAFFVRKIEADRQSITSAGLTDSAIRR